MLNEEEKIIHLLDNFAANYYVEFLINNSTKDFIFIRPSVNSIDTLGFVEIKNSGDLSDG